ncbi:unnamed protein product [Cylicocyclus nassatus]|uniref:Uncharacterized protein n=1 Tax=Cylicocyclus nassatus TaxID=53992 RepID=A0AA36GFM1_CYLNA|nr:unnamed protein product [Cylicocyclus nassatus]
MLQYLKMVFYFVLTLLAALPVCQGFDLAYMPVDFGGPNEGSPRWKENFTRALSKLCGSQEKDFMIYSEKLGALIDKAYQNMPEGENGYTELGYKRVYRTRGLDRGDAKAAAESFAAFLQGKLGSVTCQTLKGHRHFRCRVFRVNMGLWIGQPIIYCAFSNS